MPEVLERVAAGDGAAVGECLDRYGGAVWRLAVRCLGDGPEARDATREVFLLLWSSAHRFEPAAWDEPAFVMSLARRRVLDARRAGTPRPARAIEEPPAPGGDSAWGDECERAGAALRGLASEERAALWLVIRQGLDHAEVGAATDTPAQTARARIRRGLRRVARSLEPRVGARP